MHLTQRLVLLRRKLEQLTKIIGVYEFLKGCAIEALIYGYTDTDKKSFHDRSNSELNLKNSTELRGDN